MEKTAKSYKDPALNKIIQEKAAWNKQVSALINDLIHFKKSMNGWPSKYYKERTRISQPAPIDFGGILSQIANEFQDIASTGNSILSEQAAFSKAHMKRKTDQTLDTLDRLRGPVDEKPGTPTAPPAGAAPNLTQQLGKGASRDNTLIKLASEFEGKYFLESQASNPFTRFVTRLFNPKFGFGEGARVRRLRMTMLDNCVKSLKALKVLHKEIVKSSSASIVNSHKMMTSVWNYWNIVNRLFSAYKVLKPGEVKDPGGTIEDPELKREKAIEEGRDPDAETPVPETPATSVALRKAEMAAKMIKDYRENVSLFGNDPEIIDRVKELNSVVERIMATPESARIKALQDPNIMKAYHFALRSVNAEWGTDGTTFQETAAQRKEDLAKRHLLFQPKTAQRQLGKFRHQLLPGATSGSRLEVYNLIDQIRKDLDIVMNLLEQGFDQKALATSINSVNRQMATLRTMIRSLYYSEKPEEASSPFF